MRDRVKEFRRVPASELVPNPNNWRTHPAPQMDALRAVLEEVGFAGAELVRELPDGRLELIDGHARAKLCGEAEVPVLVLDVNDAEAKKLLATFDPIGAMAESDGLALDRLLRDFDTGSEALASMVADLHDKAMASIDIDVDAIPEDEPPPKPDGPTRSKVGDIWILGDHRVACGDCTDRSVMDRLMQGRLADMVFTDPPYNVAYTGKTKEALTIQNDAMDGVAFLEFLNRVFESLATKVNPGGAAYICHADSEGMRFRQAFETSGFELKQCLIWVKNTMVMGRQDYHWKHEPILYGWRSGAAHRFYGGRKVTTVFESGDGVDIRDDGGRFMVTVNINGRCVSIECDNASVVVDDTDEAETVWRVARPTRNKEHPTMKPVRLCARAITHGSRVGDIVLDGFLGSGSTLMAAEHTKRRCYGTELDPKYCDVVISRWENETGEKASKCLETSVTSE